MTKPPDWNERAYGGLYELLRDSVMPRNGGTCAFCGLEKATDCHHSPMAYPDGGRNARDRYEAGNPKAGDLRYEHLVQLCEPCHAFSTNLRKFAPRLGITTGVLFRYINDVLDGPEEEDEGKWSALLDRIRKDGHFRKNIPQPREHRTDSLIHKTVNTIQVTDIPVSEKHTESGIIHKRIIPVSEML